MYTAFSTPGIISYENYLIKYKNFFFKYLAKKMRQIDGYTVKFYHKVNAKQSPLAIIFLQNSKCN